MQPIKYTASQTNIINLGTKTIYKYPSPTKQFDVGRMVIKGRYPESPDSFIVEHSCSFVMYFIKGNGSVYVGSKVFDVSTDDVVFIPANNNFAIEGDLEYITFDSPAFFPEQSEEIKS